MIKYSAIFISIIFQIFIANTGYAQKDCSMSVPDIFSKTSSSVVLINAVSIDPFKISDRFTSSIGSGFIIDSDGTILTNCHVVFGGQAISVTLNSGITVPADLLGADPILDLAVLKIAGNSKDLPFVQMGDSDNLKIGEEVVAIGNPLGLEQTLTRGVISGMNRVLPSSPMGLTTPLIQTDAAINPGNSGGPLLNQCGEVIGVNTSVILGSENIGFAVPINVAKKSLSELVEKGRIVRPWIGFRGKIIKKDQLESIFKLPFADGFLVEMVEPGSPAEKANIQSGEIPIIIGNQEFLIGGDIIILANGYPLTDQHGLENLAKSIRINDRIVLEIFRNNKKLKAELVVSERPLLPWDFPPMGSNLISPTWNNPEN